MHAAPTLDHSSWLWAAVTSSTAHINYCLTALQVCPYDARHTIATLSRISRHPAVSSLALYVYEEEPEVLARHMLLLHVLLDGSLTARERVETLLELHGNALLRNKTAEYLGECETCIRLD